MTVCEVCNDETLNRNAGDYACRHCCEHGDMECGHCLDCGLDRTEELSSLAYDRYKDRIKYGDE